MFWMLNYSEVCPQKWVFYQAVVVGIKDPFLWKHCTYLQNVFLLFGM